MIRSLWTGATGMHAQQFNMDTISNNLSNINTTGYKKVRPEFEDLIYQTFRTAGTPATEETVIPTGNQIGHGVKTSATQRIFQQGSLQETGNPLDLALEGKGFFKVKTIDGTEAYTRDGNFKIDANRQIVTSNGYRLLPEFVVPDNIKLDSLKIDKLGRISGEDLNTNEDEELGQINTYRFINAAGLLSLGENTFKVTEGSGPEIEGTPGLEGQPKVIQGFLEMSNVKAVDEMVNMITAQRAYELNSKTIQTSDSMLQTAIGLKQ